MNPKFVYSVDALRDCIVAGTGNGSIFLVDSYTGIISNILESVHSTAVTQT